VNFIKISTKHGKEAREGFFLKKEAKTL